MTKAYGYLGRGLGQAAHVAGLNYSIGSTLPLLIARPLIFKQI